MLKFGHLQQHNQQAEHPHGRGIAAAHRVAAKRADYRIPLFILTAQGDAFWHHYQHLIDSQRELDVEQPVKKLSQAMQLRLAKHTKQHAKHHQRQGQFVFKTDDGGDDAGL